jgi:hypothetical protein
VLVFAPLFVLPFVLSAMYQRRRVFVLLFVVAARAAASR